MGVDNEWGSWVVPRLLPAPQLLSMHLRVAELLRVKRGEGGGRTFLV